MFATRSRLGLLSALALSAAFSACGGDDPAPGAPATSPPPGISPTDMARASGRAPEAVELRALIERARALLLANDTEPLRALIVGALPTRADLRAVVRPGADADAWLERFRGATRETTQVSDPSKAGWVTTTETETRVHEATTEELAADAEGSVARREFPRGMRDFASRLAAPGRAWYVVERRKPGSDRGSRMSCFTRIDGRWVLISGAWTALPAEPASDTSRAPDAPK